MMMQIDIMTYAGAALVLTGWAAMFAFVGLKVWDGWLALKRSESELASRHATTADPVPLSAAARIDMADLKERVRKLEAIASGVDL